MKYKAMINHVIQLKKEKGGLPGSSFFYTFPINFPKSFDVSLCGSICIVKAGKGKWKKRGEKRYVKERSAGKNY